MKFWICSEAASHYAAPSFDAETLSEWRSAIAGLPADGMIRFVSADVFGDGESHLLQLGDGKAVATMTGLRGASHARVVWEKITRSVAIIAEHERGVAALCKFAVAPLPRQPLRLVFDRDATE